VRSSWGGNPRHAQPADSAQPFIGRALSLGDLAGTFLARGIVFSHEAVRTREAELAPCLPEELRRERRGRVGESWYADETYYRRVGGRWCYLHRAVDRNGSPVDALPSERRDPKAARAFLRSAGVVTGMVPARVTTDGHDSYPGAIRSEPGRNVRHRTSTYLDSRVERDHQGRYVSPDARPRVGRPSRAVLPRL